MNSKSNAKREQQIGEVAKKVLGLDTLETRNSDSLDFSEHSTAQLRAALIAAYEAGVAAGKASK